jgi:hypothetical protein
MRSNSRTERLTVRAPHEPVAGPDLEGADREHLVGVLLRRFHGAIRIAAPFRVVVTGP